MVQDFRSNTLVVEGFSQLNRAFRSFDDEVAVGMRHELKEAGEIVRVDAAARMAKYDRRSAVGFRTVSDAKNVWVKQSIRGTGARPQFGALQMTKALLPALDARRGDVEARFEHLLDQVMVANFGL